MSLFSNMTNKTVMRAFPWIWYIRLVQIVISVLVLALAAVDSHTVEDLGDGCGIPPRIAYNLACAVLAIITLIYFILATGPNNAFKCLPWLVWGQIALDALMFIFWLAAAATSTFSYKDICDACPSDGVYYDNFFYSCIGYAFVGDDGNIYSRDLSPLPRGLPGMEKRARPVRRAKRGTALGRTTLDSVMTILFAITLAATIWWVITQQRRSGTAAPTMRPPAHEESGVPMTATQQPGQAASNPQTQPVQYYVVQGQPQQQQQQHQEQKYEYQQSAPQSQYPPQTQPVQYHVVQGQPQQQHQEQKYEYQQSAPQSQYPPQPQQQFVNQKV